ncbi:MAG: S24 family peptidase, partial [Bacteroides sp.]
MDSLYSWIEQMAKTRGFKNVTELCKAAKVSRSVLSELNSGRTTGISMSSASKFAKTLNIPVDWITSMEQPSILELIANDNKLNSGANLLYASQQKKSATKGDTVSIPILGDVAAGIPIEALENILGYEDISPDLLKYGDEFFGLRIKGNSMEPRICEGDIVIVKKQSTAVSGDVVVVLINGESATVKRIKRSENGIMLCPFNHDYEPAYYSNEDIETLPVAVIGKVIELRA